jgi:hypothetical protein
MADKSRPYTLIHNCIEYARCYQCSIFAWEEVRTTLPMETNASLTPPPDLFIANSAATWQHIEYKLTTEWQALAFYICEFPLL